MLLVLAAISALIAVAQQPDPTMNVPPGSRIVLQAKGDGVQIYTCTKAPTGDVKWGPSTPKAKLRDAKGKVIGTHFAGPTWKLKNGGQVQAQLIPPPHPSPKEGAIPWLELSAKPGTATGSLAEVTYITRTDTHDGVAPATGCTERKVGRKGKVHYTATYTFYAEKK